jgi:UDPglucose 6-dehydrogenase
MQVTVLGLWHLGTVTAACLAAAGHDVTGLDFDPGVIEGLDAGRPPLFEPGLEELVLAGRASGHLRFTTDAANAVPGRAVLWVTYDTPVDDEDRADVDDVLVQVRRTFPYLDAGTLVLISSQLPVGTARRLEQEFAGARPGVAVSFACSPENLRLGKAIDVFSKPDRVIVGVRSAADRALATDLFGPITNRLEFMSVESAEMTKHAVNAFLATSVTFINELATLCERVGADAKDVERGLKTESRIGPKAYLGPGAAFAGGTLARDVVFLRQLGQQVGRPTPLMDGVDASNREHRSWARQRLEQEMGGLAGKTIAVWGLTYKPGTDTLRRSMAAELCGWLLAQGAHVRVHDAAVKDLPPELRAVSRAETPIEAARGAEALVVATEWPEYRQVPADALETALCGTLVLDANRFLGSTLGADARFRLVSVGRG